MVTFSNPVAGRIYAKGEAHPAGAFAVTSTFADHIASGRGPGIDIGNGTCGFDILSVGRFKVEQAFTVSSGAYAGAKVVRYRLLDAPEHQIGIAHMDRIETAVGVTGPAGVVIGHAGSSGGVACHLHMGDKPTWLAGQAIDEIDWWPRLAQNSTGGDMIPIPTAAYTAIANKKTALAVQANFRAERLTTAPVLKVFPVGTAFVPSVSANDGSAAGGTTPTLWYGGFLYDDSPAGFIFGWFHSSVIGPLVDAVAAGGFSQAQLNAAVKVASDPLLARIASIKAKVAAGASDIADD